MSRTITTLAVMFLVFPAAACAEDHHAPAAAPPQTWPDAVFPAAASRDEDRHAPPAPPAQTWLAALAEAGEPEEPPVGRERSDPNAAKDPAADPKSVPLPFHCIEGYSGGAITPMAYMCNYCNCGCEDREHLAGPSVSYSYMRITSKQLHTVALTQAIRDRVEFGFAVNQLWLGSLYDDVKKQTPMDPVRRDVYLYHFNVRGKLLGENSFDLPLPAIGAGVHLKHNHGLNQINRRLGKAFSAIGMDKNYGVDYTLTATKMFPTLAFGRPVIVTGGARLSKAAQLGLLGFGKTYRGSFEGSVVCLPTDELVLGYEFREKRNPYGKIPGLIGDEDNWHALSASVIVDKHLTVSVLAGLLGHVANANADTTWGLQIKWEF